MQFVWVVLAVPGTFVTYRSSLDGSVKRLLECRKRRTRWSAALWMAKERHRSGVLNTDVKLAQFRGYFPLSAMGTVADCYDNAMCESFLATLECELLDRRFKTQAEARMAIFRFIESWYNPHRANSRLDYLSPIDYERKYAA